MNDKELRGKKTGRKGNIVLSLPCTLFHSFSLHCPPLFRLSLLILLLSPFTLNAQIRIQSESTNSQRMSPRGNPSSSANPQGNRPLGDSTYSDTSATKGLEYHEEIPDSVLRNKVFFFNYGPRDVKINEVWNPTLDPTGVQFNDPLDGLNGNYYLGKGVIGHPHMSILYTFADGLSHCLQEDEMDGYVKTPENVRLYQTLTPYTVLSYNSSLKKDSRVHVAHTQNIRPGWNLSFDYQLMCPEGVLASSGAKDHFLDATTNYFSDDSRLQVQAGFIWQSFAIDENGGLVNDSIFTNNVISNFAGLPVRYSNSGSKHLRNDVFGRVTYNLVRQVERYRERDSLVVREDSTQTIKQSDNQVILDTIVVIDTLRVGTPRVLNAGVFGAEARYHRQKRAAYITNLADSTLWNETLATLFWTNDAYLDYHWRNPLKITLGATLSSSKYAIESIGSITASPSISPFAKIDLQLWRGSLTLEGEIDNSVMNLNSVIKQPDYHASALLSHPFDSAEMSGFELSAALQRQMPEVRMLMTAGFGMEPILSQSLGMHLFSGSDSGFVRLVDLDMHASRLDHYVWYDSSAAVQISNQSLWMYHAALTMRLAAGWMHLDMQQLLQHSTDPDQISVPLWASKNSLYGDFTLFGGALRMQVGTDVRYFTSFTPDGYDPATGVFYTQDTEVGNSLWVDVFLNLQVKRASIYLKAGHLNALWENHPRYFLLPHYPSQKFALLWGMTWHFFD